MVDDSTEDLEGTVQAEPDNHTHTDDEHPPPPLCRVSHAPHVATWTGPASPAPSLGLPGRIATMWRNIARSTALIHRDMVRNNLDHITVVRKHGPQVYQGWPDRTA